MSSSIRNIRVFFIDPQSVNNMAEYDYNVLSDSRNHDVLFWGNEDYEYKERGHMMVKPLFSYNKKKTNFAKGISYICSFLVIAMYLLRYRPLIVHVQWMKFPSFDYGFYRVMKSLFHFKLIFTAHNILPHNRGEEYRKIYQKIYDLTDAIIVHAKITRDEIVSSFHIASERIHVIPHGLLGLCVDREKYENHLKEYDNKYNLSNKTVFTSLGAQNAYKGTDILVEVWASTPELNQAKDCALVVVGKNENIDVDALIKCGNVIYDNRIIPDEEFFYILTHTDVCLLPYRKISQSGILLTSLNYHIPVLVSCVGGIAEPLDYGKVGWKMDEASFEALRDKLIWLSQNKHEIERVKSDSKQWDVVCRKYDWGTICKTTRSLYETLMK